MKTTMLVVKDEQDTAELLKCVLERTGFLVTHAKDGRQATTLIETTRLSTPSPSGQPEKETGRVTHSYRLLAHREEKKRRVATDARSSNRLLQFNESSLRRPNG